MNLTSQEQALLDGAQGRAAAKAMQILLALGNIYGAQSLVPVTSVQISGVSYDNLGESGLNFLNEMADGGGEACVLTTLNPAGMDIHNWRQLGIDPDFAEKQQRVIQAFARMGVVTTCTCTPYLAGNLPHFGEHIAWAESSAVCYANSVIGARTNREGGPSALAASLTGRTPRYGMHLEENRVPDLTVRVEAQMNSGHYFGALGKAVGMKMEKIQGAHIPYILGIERASVQDLKTLCASIGTYGGTALFHIPGITPEAERYSPPVNSFAITQADLDSAVESLNDARAVEIDFVSLGCPHLSIQEIAHLARLLEGRQVQREFWITTSRSTKKTADLMGYSQVIEGSGAKFAVDTCCVVAPIKGRFKAMATDSAKACYYAYAKNNFKTRLLPFDQVVQAALGEND